MRVLPGVRFRDDLRVAQRVCVGLLVDLASWLGSLHREAGDLRRHVWDVLQQHRQVVPRGTELLLASSLQSLPLCELALLLRSLGQAMGVDRAERDGQLWGPTVRAEAFIVILLWGLWYNWSATRVVLGEVTVELDDFLHFMALYRFTVGMRDAKRHRLVPSFLRFGWLDMTAACGRR